MATEAEARNANAYARGAGYRKGKSYSPFNLGVPFTAHRGHGHVVYNGVNNGHLEFRCEGCSDTIFVRPA